MKRTILLAIAGLTAGCTARQPANESEPCRVETLVVQASSVAAERSYVGVVEEETAVALSFPVGGTVARIGADEGRRVAEGDLLAELDPTSARQSYEAAKVSFEQAQDACDRLRRLYDENSLPEIQWVEARTKLRQAESMLGIAEKNLKDCSLRAPFSGVVGKRIATVGETALPGVPVITVLKIDAVKVRFAVPEREIGRLSAEDCVFVTVAALDDRRFRAGKPEKGIAGDAATHAYDVRARIPNPANELLPGMVCRVEVVPADAEERIVVPIRAIRQCGSDNRFVWVVRGDSVVRNRVETGKTVGNDIVVSEGLKSGDRVVVGGMQKIGEGSKVVWE